MRNEYGKYTFFSCIAFDNCYSYNHERKVFSGHLGGSADDIRVCFYMINSLMEQCIEKAYSSDRKDFERFWMLKIISCKQFIYCWFYNSPFFILPRSHFASFSKERNSSTHDYLFCSLIGERKKSNFVKNSFHFCK